MSEHETQEDQMEGLDQQEDSVIQPDSIMGKLRQQHQDMKQSKTLDLPIPGYDGMLVAKYRLLHIKELEIIGERVQREVTGTGERVTLSSIDAIATACLGLYYNRDGELVGLNDSIGPDEAAIRFDDRLIAFLKLDISDEGIARIMPDGMSGIERLGPARRTVLAVWGGNDIAIIDHSRAIGQWSSDTSKRVTEAFLARS